MTEADLNKERTLAYTAGYNAAKAEQPVGLTEEEISEWESHRNSLTREAVYRLDTNDIDRHRELATSIETVDNLLARDAAAKEAGMVCDATAERLRKAEALLESCWMVMDAFGGGGGSGKGNMRATMKAVDEFLGDPEAEAALAAKGGE
jgi:hypothetical protein